MDEIWIDIKGYETIYKISNLGNVKSLNFNRTKKEKELLKINGTDGYDYITLTKNGIQKRYPVHRLVCSHFITEDINNKVINHIDFNRKNNNVSNLESITHRENMSHSNKHKTKSCNSIGVVFHKRDKKYQASIKVNNKRIHLGYFDTELEAKNTYDNYLIKNNLTNKYK